LGEVPQVVLWVSQQVLLATRHKGKIENRLEKEAWIILRLPYAQGRIQLKSEENRYLNMLIL